MQGPRFREGQPWFRSYLTDVRDIGLAENARSYF